MLLMTYAVEQLDYPGSFDDEGHYSTTLPYRFKPPRTMKRANTSASWIHCLSTAARPASSSCSSPRRRPAASSSPPPLPKRRKKTNRPQNLGCSLHTICIFMKKIMCTCSPRRRKAKAAGRFRPAAFWVGTKRSAIQRDLGEVAADEGEKIVFVKFPDAIFRIDHTDVQSIVLHEGCTEQGFEY